VPGLQSTARTAGFAYLVIIVLAAFTELSVREGAIELGDETVTAANILARESLWRLGYLAEMIVASCDIIVAVLLYALLKPALAYFAALMVLGGGDYLSGFTSEQAHSLSYLFLRLHGEAYDLALFFFGLNCLLLGWLIMRATFLPRVIGLLMVIAGACYLGNAATGVLAPRLSPILFPWVLIPAFVAELGLALWLSIMGVNRDAWRVQAAEWRASF